MPNKKTGGKPKKSFAQKPMKKMVKARPVAHETAMEKPAVLGDADALRTAKGAKVPALLRGMKDILPKEC